MSGNRSGIATEVGNGLGGHIHHTGKLGPKYLNFSDSGTDFLVHIDNEFRTLVSKCQGDGICGSRVRGNRDISSNCGQKVCGSKTSTLISGEREGKLERISRSGIATCIVGIARSKSGCRSLTFLPADFTTLGEGDTLGRCHSTEHVDTRDRRTGKNADLVILRERRLHGVVVEVCRKANRATL